MNTNIKTMLHQDLENWLNEHSDKLESFNSSSNDSVFMISADHEHHASDGGFKICPLCRQKFDVPIIAIVKNDIVIDSNKNEERHDVLPSGNQRTTTPDHDVRGDMGERKRHTDSNQGDSSRNGKPGINRDENHSSGERSSEEAIHPKSLRPIKPIVIRSTEERIK